MIPIIFGAALLAYSLYQKSMNIIDGFTYTFTNISFRKSNFQEVKGSFDMILFNPLTINIPVEHIFLKIYANKTHLATISRKNTTSLIASKDNRLSFNYNVPVSQVLAFLSADASQIFKDYNSINITTVGFITVRAFDRGIDIPIKYSSSVKSLLEDDDSVSGLGAIKFKKVMSGKELLSACLKDGWRIVAVHGSHHTILKNGTKIDIPIHGNRDIPVGTYHSIIKVIKSV